MLWPHGCRKRLALAGSCIASMLRLAAFCSQSAPFLLTRPSRRIKRGLGGGAGFLKNFWMRSMERRMSDLSIDSLGVAQIAASLPIQSSLAKRRAPLLRRSNLPSRGLAQESIARAPATAKKGGAIRPAALAAMPAAARLSDPAQAAFP